MSKRWIRAKRPEFARDVLRDFCLASDELEKLFQRYDKEGVMPFEPLRQLLGKEMSKGLLWRLKDTAHLLFRFDPEAPLVAKCLDWGISYIFHEAMKLKEDAYQQQTYGPWFRELRNQELPETQGRFIEELSQILGQTRESIDREVRRVRFIITQCLGMFPLYYAQYRDNPLLARLIFEQRELLRNVLGDSGLAELERGVYGDHPSMLYILASQSLRQGGWLREARKAASKALEIAPDCPEGLREQRLLDNLSRKLSTRKVLPRH